MRFSKGMTPIVPILAAALLTGMGCSSLFQRGAKEAVQRGTGVRVEEDGGKVKVQTKEGTVETEQREGKLPSGFPDKFPVYEGATVKSGAKTSSPKGTLFSVTWESSDGVSAVVDFYKKTLPENGYPISNTVETGADTGFLLKNGMVAIKTESGKTQISVTLSIT